MSFTSYATLQAAVASWAARDDLSGLIPDYITIFECAAARKLKVRLQETTATLTPSSGVATLPTDYLGYRRVTWTGSPRNELAYVAPTIFQSDFPTQPSGTPSIFTIEGTNLRVMPQSDTALEFDYFQRTPAVSAGLNWLLSNHSDAYLFGTLTELYAANKKLDEAAAWKARRDEVFQEIAMLDFNERQGMAISTLGNTP